MFRINPPKDNAVSATYQYLKAIGAKVTEETVEETLKNHPDYPSLLAISDTLNEWNIENIVVQVHQEQLAELTTTFLTFVRVEDGIFAHVKNVSSEYVEWVHTKNGTQKSTIDDFFRIWDGVVLMAEVNEKSGEENYKENRKREIVENLRLPFLLLGATLLIGIILYSHFSADLGYNLLLVTKFLGSIVSSVLLLQSVDKNNSFVQSLCQGGKKTNCNSILSSNAAQITPWLSWSEIGFFYFFGGFLTLLISPSSLFIFQILGIMAITYTFWSIYYQGFVAKQWCIFCLIVQTLLVIEFILILKYPVNEYLSFNIKYSDLSFIIPTITQGFGIAIVIWVFLKPILRKSQQFRPAVSQLKYYKRNPDFFLSILHKKKEMPFVTQSIEPIIIGNPNAAHTITMVTNPFCKVCATTHKTIKQLLETTQNLNCQIIFKVTNVDSDTRRTMAKTIFSLPPHKRANALSAWYESREKNIEKWQKRIEVVDIKDAEKTIASLITWCELAKVKDTPALYLDGYKLPELYNIDDLKGILKYMYQTSDLAKSI